MKQFNTILQSVTAIAAMLALSLGLSGCGAKPQPIVTVKKLTLQQIRQRDQAVMTRDGVQVIRLGETVRLVMPANTLFQPDSANLLSPKEAMLNVIARYIKTFQTVNTQVAAYSDNIRNAHSPKARKQALTARQAQVIASYLWSRGIDTRLLYAVGKGSKDQVAFNNTHWGRDNNKRVEVSFRYYPRYVNYH